MSDGQPLARPLVRKRGVGPEPGPHRRPEDRLGDLLGAERQPDGRQEVADLVPALLPGVAQAPAAPLAIPPEPIIEEWQAGVEPLDQPTLRGVQDGPEPRPGR